MKRLVLPLLLLVAAACNRGSSGSPTCGIALLAGPALITSQLANARAVLNDARAFAGTIQRKIVLWSPWADITDSGDSAVTLKHADPNHIYDKHLKPAAMAYATFAAIW